LTWVLNCVRQVPSIMECDYYYYYSCCSPSFWRFLLYGRCLLRCKTKHTKQLATVEQICRVFGQRTSKVGHKIQSVELKRIVFDCHDWTLTIQSLLCPHTIQSLWTGRLLDLSAELSETGTKYYGMWLLLLLLML
jgi:hypothetical protein